MITSLELSSFLMTLSLHKICILQVPESHLIAGRAIPASNNAYSLQIIVLNFAVIFSQPTILKLQNDD